MCCNSVASCRDLILECLDDRDDSIRLRALDLISGMVSKKNLVEIVKKLILHMDTSESASKLLYTHTFGAYNRSMHDTPVADPEEVHGVPRNPPFSQTRQT